MKNFLLEVAANSVASAIAAQAGGAQRVELVSALEVGGITPSHAVIELARQALDIDVYVLIRPRGGDMVYDSHEIETMRRDIEVCAELGCNGVVIGALTEQGDVDVEQCRMLVEAAGNMGVTFHRAFDLVRDPKQALEDIVALGCERILSSGAESDALSGAAQLAELVKQAKERLVIMPGAGVKADNVATIAQRSGAHEFHASAKREQPSRFEGAGLPGMAAGEDRTEEAEVRALIEALEAV